MFKVAEGRPGALLGCLLSLAGTYAAAFMFFPVNPTPRGALVVSGSVLALAIVLVPILRGLGGSRTVTNAENFVAFGFVFWLLLD